MSLAQWLGWLISIPLSWSLAWFLALLVSAPRRVLYKIRKLPLRTVWDTPIGTPLKCTIAILIHAIFVYQLDLPLLYHTGTYLAWRESRFNRAFGIIAQPADIAFEPGAQC
jgi:hypothetical protein